MRPKRLPELYKNDITRFWSKVDQKGVDKCWSWLGTIKPPDNRGMFIIGRVHKKLRRTLYAPRIAYAIYYERDPYPDDVLHNCNNANCVNPHYLRLGNARDNSADSIAAGTHFHGEGIHLAKLTKANVKEIKIALMRGTAAKNLAEIFKVEPRAIRRIQRGVTWKHVEVPGFKPLISRRHNDDS